MYEYLLYFFITLIFSTLFSLSGVGSAVALVPIFNILGLPLNFSKAIGLFVNTSTTITASFMNLKRGVLDISFAYPLVITLMLFAPFGAYLSKFVSVEFVKVLLVVFLIFSASMMLFGKKEAKTTYQKRWVLFLLGTVVGMISGMLGIGGGSLILPLLILLGYETKQAAFTVSFVIPFSTFSAFLTYASFVKIDWLLLGITAIAAILGGFIGNKILHFKLDAIWIKKITALILFVLSAKLIYSL